MKLAFVLQQLSPESAQMEDTRSFRVIDFRPVDRERRSFLCSQVFEALRPGCSFILRTEEEPGELHKQFNLEFQGRFEWDKIREQSGCCEILITKVR